MRRRDDPDPEFTLVELQRYLHHHADCRHLYDSEAVEPVADSFRFGLYMPNQWYDSRIDHGAGQATNILDSDDETLPSILFDGSCCV